MGAWEIIKAGFVLGAFVYRTVKKHQAKGESFPPPPPPPPPRGRRK